MASIHEKIQRARNPGSPRATGLEGGLAVTLGRASQRGQQVADALGEGFHRAHPDVDAEQPEQPDTAALFGEAVGGLLGRPTEEGDTAP